jgi:hypothetical protein
VCGNIKTKGQSTFKLEARGSRDKIVAPDMISVRKAGRFLMEI